MATQTNSSDMFAMLPQVLCGSLFLAAFGSTFITF
jgi:hypothetical protein